MFCVNRNFVCERLAISDFSSRRLFPASSVKFISSDSVIKTLNRSRRGDELELTFIPSDIITPETASAETGIPVQRLLTWTRRRVKKPPHFRLSKLLIRFRRDSINRWLENKVSK